MGDKKELKLHISDDNLITIGDSSGDITVTSKSNKITLKAGSNASIEIDGAKGQITIQAGASKVVIGPTVDMNSGALTVSP